ncbi:30S ribosomal protein S17 [uncultured archaeon]|nr:30S ribosomal protein S17 [uncultured archaeon]
MKDGILSTRGMIFEGKVVSAKAKNTCIIEIHYKHPVYKYERFEKRRSKLAVHVPDGIEVKEGDTVQAMECRKISKTKSHVVVSVNGKKVDINARNAS